MFRVITLMFRVITHMFRVITLMFRAVTLMFRFNLSSARVRVCTVLWSTYRIDLGSNAGETTIEKVRRFGGGFNVSFL